MKAFNFTRGMVTLQQIASAAGYSLATTSYALRNDQRIHPETRSRIHAVAARLGYRPNPSFSALMAHVRQGRSIEAGDRIAFIWVRTNKEESSRNRLLREVYEGARQRAEALGYRLEQFWAEEDGMSGRRLSEILRSRGIVGVLLSPVMGEGQVSLDLEWEHFSPAVIGSAAWSPELHHAGHYHYLAMRMALSKLAEAGYRRPMAVVNEMVNERAHRSWQAAFLVYHPAAESAGDFFVLESADRKMSLASRLKKLKPDVLIVSDASVLARLEKSMKGSVGLPVATLHWVPERPDLMGVDQSYDSIAANAVEIVATQLKLNQLGIPALPRMLLFPGTWREISSGAARSDQ